MSREQDTDIYIGMPGEDCGFFSERKVEEQKMIKEQKYKPEKVGTKSRVLTPEEAAKMVALDKGLSESLHIILEEDK